MRKGQFTPTHGMSGSPTYISWASMIARCTRPSHRAYARYGGRGITVCEEWRRFEGFLADMGVRPDGTSLDRIDGNRGYEPGNVRWATASEQSKNRDRSAYSAETSKTHCPAGHLYDDENTYISPQGWRQCRTCINDNQRRRRALTRR